jgi:hypothetical protein
MATHSTFTSDDLTRENERTPGHDVRSLGPSDSSDTGADMIGPGLLDNDALALGRGTSEDSEGGHLRPQGGGSFAELALDDNSDREGTGGRASAGVEQDIRPANDIEPDSIVGPDEAGVGYGLDEAEEARIHPLDGRP